LSICTRQALLTPENHGKRLSKTLGSPGDGVTARYKHLFLDAEGTLYLPRKGYTARDFWKGEHTIERATEMFEIPDNVISTLAEMRKSGVVMHVVSLHLEGLLAKLLDSLGIGHFFHDLIINGDKGKRIEAYASEHGISRNDCLMVGDRYDLDIAPVHARGIRAILLDREGSNRHPIPPIQSVDELTGFINV